MEKNRSRRLLWQIYPLFFMVTVVAIIAVSWYFSSALKEFHHQDSVASLRARAELIAFQVQNPIRTQSWDELNQLCREAGVKISTRITILLPNGQVIGDTREDPERMENHAARPEVIEALNGQVANSSRFSRTLQKEMMYLAVPVLSAGTVVGVVRTAMSVDAVEARISVLRERVVAGGMIVSLLVALLSLAISRRISRPLEQIKQEAERYAKGDFEHRLRVSGSSEIVTLAQALNEMAAQLNDRITTIDKQRNEQDSVLSSMVEGVIAIDSNQNVLRINPAAARLLDVDVQDVVGLSVQQVVRKAELLDFITNTMGSELAIEEDMVLFSGEAEMCIQAHGTMLRGSNGKSIGALVVFNDLTRMRRLETMRRDFVANVSHELKTPITAIKGFVETLLDGALDDRQNSEDFLHIIERQVERLSIIIEDLMSLSRIEQGEEKQNFELESGNLVTIVDEAINDCSMLATQMGITLEGANSGPVSVALNGALLEQALTNLIDNAIKYSAEGTSVLVSCIKRDGMAEVRVVDHGCGIEAEHLPRLFERFYRVDKARSRKAGGSGLGLAIVKHIVQIHHGDVEVKSVHGQGSQFIIRLPLA
jgi:two-component system phosphate regulon sensor histidine kinase PhoR